MCIVHMWQKFASGCIYYKVRAVFPVCMFSSGLRLKNNSKNQTQTIIFILLGFGICAITDIDGNF